MTSLVTMDIVMGGGGGGGLSPSKNTVKGELPFIKGLGHE